MASDSGHAPSPFLLEENLMAMYEERLRRLRRQATPGRSADGPARPVTNGSTKAPRTGAMAPTEAQAAELLGVEHTIPTGVRIAAGWSWRVLIIVALIAGIGWLLGYLSEVTIPLAVAILLTAMLTPVNNRLVKWGVPRHLSVAISVLGGILIVAGVLTLVVTQIISQSSSLVTSATSGFTQVTDWLQNGPLNVSSSVLDTSALTTRVTNLLRESQSSIATYAAEAGSQVGHFLAGLAITIFALFYFLSGGRGIWTFLLRFFPRPSRDSVDRAVLKGWVALGHYVRATILVAAADAVGVLIAAEILRVPLAPALAALVFIGAFVPIVGAFVSGFVAVLIALVTLGPIKALIMLAAIVFVMEVEAHVLQPFLLGRAVKLHPLAVLLGIAIGVVVAGIVGALMSIPLLAFFKTFIQSLVQGDAPPVEEQAAAEAG